MARPRSANGGLSPAGRGDLVTRLRTLSRTMADWNAQAGWNGFGALVWE